MPDLTALAAEISQLGETIKTLKTSGGDKAAIDDAVAKLLAAKQEYADNNNGIGVDGKPYEKPLSKKEKKEKEKAEKAAKAASAAGNVSSVVFSPCVFVERLISFSTCFFFFSEPAR